MINKITCFILTAFVLTLCTSCKVTPRDLGTFPREKLVVVNGRGHLLEPVGNVSKTTYSSLREMQQFVPHPEEDTYIQSVATHIQNRLAQGQDVVMFIHGGLNMQVTTMARARALFDFERGEREADRPCPEFILVNWQSALLSSYRDRLCAIREGKDFREREWLARQLTRVTSPGYLTSDLLRGIARAPVTLDRQLDNLREGSGFLPRQDLAIANRDFKQAGLFAPPVLSGQTKTDWRQFAPGLLASPLRLALTPAVDAFGTPSWDIMQRRTTILFSRESVNGRNTLKWAQGPLYKLGAQFDQSKFGSSTQKGAKLTLICHSMGTILGCEMLRRFPDLHFDEVVFMAAACRVRDLSDCVVPYLTHPGNQASQFYNLTLHPDAEVRESSAFYLAPQGSLLVWIDQMFDRPDSALDRTAGRYTNLGLNALYLHSEIERRGGPALAKRMHIKCFPYEHGGLNIPMEHGAFGDFHFWEPDFYQPEAKQDTFRRYFPQQQQTR